MGCSIRSIRLKFTFTVDCAKKQMLFLGFRPGQGGMVFAEAGNLKVKPATVKKGGVVWEVSGSVLNNKYRDFLKACAVVRNDRLLDSLDALFFTARDREDREEMARAGTDGRRSVGKTNG